MDNTFNQAFKPLTNIKTIKEYEAEIESLRNENFELKSRLSQNYNPSVVNDDIKKLLLDSQTSINILENENKELRNQLQFLSNGNDSHLKIENEKLLKYIEKMNEEIEVQNERNNEEKNEMYREICDMKEKMTEFGNLKARNAELEQQYNILNEELHRRNIGTKQLQAQNSKEMQEKINAYENRIQSMNAEINSLLEKVSFLSKANEEYVVLKDKATYLEQQNHELQSKVGKLDGQNANYKLTIKNLEEQKAQLTKNNTELNNMYEEIRMQRNVNTNEQECTLADLRNKNNLLQQEIKNLSDKYNSAKAKIRDLEKENNAFKNEQNVLGAKIGTKETYISNLQAKINKYEIYVNKVKQDHSKLQNENKLLIEQKEYLEGQISSKMSTTDNKDAIRKLESEIEKLARINHAYRKFLSDESKNKRKIYETILQFKKTLKGYASIIDNIRNKSRQIYNKENAKGQNFRFSHGELYSNINSKNKEFLQKLFPNQRSINVIISEISKMYDIMTCKIENLESELKQITYFAGNNAKNKNKKTLALIDNFVGEFKSAKDELEFCKDYLKEKGKELKELRKCKKENEAYIHNLEEKLKNNKSLGGFMDFFTVNKQAAK